MSNVIDFLEQFGQDAGLRYAAHEIVAEALQRAGIHGRLREAILDKDPRALEKLLGADTNVCCMIHKEDDEEEEEEEEEEGEEEGEDKAVLRNESIDRAA